MALTMVGTGKTDWNIQEASEDAEFRSKDDEDTRQFRMTLRIVLSREHQSVGSIDLGGSTELPSDAIFSARKSNGPTTVAFEDFLTHYKQLDVVSSRLMAFEAKGGDFMQEVIVIEGFSEWADFDGDAG